MPGILGILRLSGSKSLADETARFNVPLVLDPNVRVLSFDGKIGFGSLGGAPNIYPAPTPIAARDLTITADACLTNRKELISKLEVPHSERSAFPDSRLILLAFEKWGEDCVGHLNGDFAFALWNNKDQKLVCARDHMGGSKFFYQFDKDKFVFAGSPGGVLRFKGVENSFNKDKFATFLLPEPHTLTAEQSWFRNILPLAAGTILTVDAAGLKLRKYWRPERVEPLTYKRNEEILEAFRELVFRIIEERLNGFEAPSCLLSGGLDSSSIAAVAAKVLEQKGQAINLISVVLDRRDDPHFVDEREFIDQFKSFPNARIMYTSAHETGPFSDLTGFFSNYDSPIISSRHYLFTAFVNEACKIGSKTIFDGAFGEAGPTFFGEGCFAEMFRTFNWLTLWRELRLRKKLYGESVRYNIRANTLNPLLPDLVVKLKRGNVKEESSLNSLHPLRNDLFQSLAARTEFPEKPYGRLSPDHRVNQLNDITFLHHKISEIPSSTFGREPVEFRHPYLDKSLLEFCLAAPLDLKVHNGYTRYLVRAGLDRILPPKIQWRTSKSPFSPDYLRRYSAQIGQVKRMLNEIRPNDPIRDVLDINRIIGWADSSDKLLARRVVFDKNAFNTVPEAIYLICFLRRFPEFRS